MTTTVEHVPGSTYVYRCRKCTIEVRRDAPFPVERIHHVCKAIYRDALERTLFTIPQDQPEIRDHVQEILAETTQPTLADKAKHYAQAVIRWRAAGYPVRSEELQEACRLTCQGCPSGQFDLKTETCKVCGCSVKKSRFAIRDKVKMATEVCHRDHWPEAVDTTEP